MTKAKKNIKLINAGKGNPAEVILTDIRVDILPEAAKLELKNYYEYLVYKYLKNIERLKIPAKEKNKNLTAFHRFKKLRDRINPVIDKSIDIDRLCNEVNSDIF